MTRMVCGVILACIVLTGCSMPLWDLNRHTQEEFKRDDHTCAKAALLPWGLYSFFGGWYGVKADYTTCMELHGYVKTGEK